MLSTIYHIFRNECPNCNKGKVFADNFYFGLGFPKMHTHCSNCNTKYEKEPGFFFGAMFVNYGLAVGEALLVFALTSLIFTETYDYRKLIIISAALLLLVSFNIRLSRMIWIYAFKNYSN